MTAPLSDERLAEIEARARLVYDAAEDPIQLAGYDVPALVAEICRLRYAHASLAAAFDGVCGERHQAQEAEQESRALLARFVSHVPCTPDLDGYCRSHSLSPAPCRNAEARRLLGLDTAADANPDVCRDCYGRGDDFEGGTCGRCRGTGGAA